MSLVVLVFFVMMSWFMSVMIVDRFGIHQNLVLVRCCSWFPDTISEIKIKCK